MKLVLTTILPLLSTLLERSPESFAYSPWRDEDTTITGRIDILAVNNAKNINPYFWILVIETKNSQIDALAGLPQLLTYAFGSLEHQESAWGLTTNGVSYRFVYLQAGNPLTYQLMPEVNLIDTERAVQLLQILKAICKL